MPVGTGATRTVKARAALARDTVEAAEAGTTDSIPTDQAAAVAAAVVVVWAGMGSRRHARAGCRTCGG